MAPDIPAPTYVHVVTAAGRRCECTGSCGRDHTARHGDGRCPVGAGLRAGARLVAAPTDPAVPAHQAYRVPVEGLSAWCGPCLDRARRLAAASRPVTPTDIPSLFEIDITGGTT
jgi:hypothetical protein